MASDKGATVYAGAAEIGGTITSKPASGIAAFSLTSSSSNDSRINFGTVDSGTFWSFLLDYSDSQKLFILDENGDDGVYMDTGDTSWSANSDERMKTKIVELDGALDKLNTLRCVNFEMKHDPDYKRIGLIAQDVYEVYPEATSGSPDDEYSYDQTRDGNSHEGAMGLRHTDLIAPLIKAVQELSAEVESLKEQLNN